MRRFKNSFIGVAALALSSCIGQPSTQTIVAPPPEDPAQVAVGERLFLETRFAQFFASKNFSNVNQVLGLGDPVMDFALTTRESLPGSFAGQSMNCRACHLVDEQLSAPGGGMRTYADFARRSPIPAREDGRTTTPRNSPALVNSMLPAEGELFLHFDGEFGTIEDLVKATYTGRNFGWMPTEHESAVKNLARVVRGDDGFGALAGEFESLSYETLLTGTDPTIPVELQLPPEFRIDVANASDQEIFDGVAKLVGAYVRNLLFIQDTKGEFDGSPYDRFLKVNGLPRQPDPGESNLDYARRLLQRINQLESPLFVTAQDGSFRFHAQPFAFGPTELEGLKVFFSEPPQLPLNPTQIASGGIGNCIACHTPPGFSDFKFHNVGVAQEEFDDVHGDGQFAALFIPDFFTRNANPELYLPPTAQHPDAAGPFLSIPDASQPGHTDLGVWNVFGNSAIPGVQEKLRGVLCDLFGAAAGSCAPQDLLPFTIALFKTPGLRDLGHSAPYFHNGSKDTLPDVIAHYRDFSELARSGTMRNAPTELLGQALATEDGEPLTAFLKSLNEDYE